jgi:hypothetical protein
MKTSALVAACVAVLLFPLHADAQPLKLQIQNGRVTLDAQNVSVRQILAEWARVGGTKIVNGEKVVGAPLTIQLQGTPERQALDIILRSVSGYMLAARQPGVTGVSAFDRIMILPTSSAPRNAGGPAPGGNPAFGSRPMPAPAMPVQVEPAEEIVDGGGDEQPVEDAEAESEGGEEAGDPGGEEDPANAPQPANRFQRRTNVFPNPLGAQMPPFTPPQPAGGQVFPGQQVNPEQPENGEATTTTPGNPFGVPAGASTTPGVVTPVPQQDPNGRPIRRPPPE